MIVMVASKLNYYGYDKETYKSCLQLIRSTTRRHITILNTWFLLVNLFYLIFSALNLFGVNQERIPFYAVYLVLSTAFELYILLFSKKLGHLNILSLYLSLCLMLSYGILSSVAQPYMPASMFLILFAISSVSYIGLMYPMVLVSTLAAGLFIWTSY